MTWQTRHEPPPQSPESGGMAELDAYATHQRFLLQACFSAVILTVMVIAAFVLLLNGSESRAVGREREAAEDDWARDLYQALELEVGDKATDAEIKKQYRRLSMQYHPDQHPDDPAAKAKYMRVAKAYEVLGDRKKRKVYDLLGAEGLKDWLRPEEDEDANPLHALFGFAPPSKKGADKRYTMAFPLADFYTGATRDLRVTKQQMCRHCRGTGANSKEDLLPCPQCHGRGVVLERHVLAPGFVQQLQAECPVCHGRGKRVGRPCPVCHGHRVARVEQVLAVELEPGTPERHSVVFEMEADEAPGLVPGDVLVTVTSERHPFFVRAGDDLKLGFRISLRDALAGFATHVEHLDGRKLDIVRAEPTPPNHVQRLSGQGMPRHGHPGDFGDLLVTYTVDFPTELTEEQRAGFRTLLADAVY